MTQFFQHYFCMFIHQNKLDCWRIHENCRLLDLPPQRHASNYERIILPAHFRKPMLDPKFHWLRQIATTLRQFHWHLFSIGHCAWFYKRGKHGSYLVLTIAPFWSRFNSRPRITSWRSQWNLGYTLKIGTNSHCVLHKLHTLCVS